MEQLNSKQLLYQIIDRNVQYDQELREIANNGDSRCSASAAFAVCCVHLLGTAR